MNAVLEKPEVATDTLTRLVNNWAKCKRDESIAADARLEVEASIIALVGEKIEGSETHDLPDGRKLTVTSKITRTIDENAWRAVMVQVPEHLRPISFVETPKLDVAGLRWLMDNDPMTYAVVAQAIVAKKAKTAITVKV